MGYLILLVYFASIGGYKLVEIGPGGEERETSEHPTAKDATIATRRRKKLNET